MLRRRAGDTWVWRCHIDLTDAKFRLAENNHAMLDAYRFDDLEFFFEMAERVSVEDAAA